MKRINSFVMPVALLLVLLAAQAQATIVNVDLEGYRTAGGGNNGVPDVTYVGTGAAGGGTVFNGVTHLAVSDNSASTSTGDNQTLSASNLLDSTGNPTTVNFTIGPVGLDNESASGTLATNPDSLFKDYVFNHSAGNSSNVNFTISGLSASSIYDVYLYAGFSNVGNLSNTAITGGTLIPTWSSGIFNNTNSKWYVVTSDPSGDIMGTMGANTNVLAGFTIVPEPSSVILFGLGALGLFVVARRRRKA